MTPDKFDGAKRCETCEPDEREKPLPSMPKKA